MEGKQSDKLDDILKIAQVAEQIGNLYAGEIKNRLEQRLTKLLDDTK